MKCALGAGIYSFLVEIENVPTKGDCIKITSQNVVAPSLPDGIIIYAKVKTGKIVRHVMYNKEKYPAYDCVLSNNPIK